jgi:hypothetical protein
VLGKEKKRFESRRDDRLILLNRDDRHTVKENFYVALRY